MWREYIVNTSKQIKLKKKKKLGTVEIKRNTDFFISISIITIIINWVHS